MIVLLLLRTGIVSPISISKSSDHWARVARVVTCTKATPLTVLSPELPCGVVHSLTVL